MHIWKKSRVPLPRSNQENVDLKPVLLCSGPSTLALSSGRAMPCTVFTGILQDNENLYYLTGHCVDDFYDFH